jgi:HEAT repeat protein
MDEIDEAIDWQGNAVDCGPCAHLAARAAGRCRLRHACVHDRYARRIDRFFDWNPDEANGYVGHPHFEVRAIAAKHASVFLLPALLDDPDETVRWNAARRVPKRYVLKLRNDPHREVRIRIVSLLEDSELAPMLEDKDYYVRLVIARRIAPSLLARMIDDPEPEVRRVVARRIPPEWLLSLASDSDAAVRVEIARRLSPGLLSRMRHDPDWRVRYEVASHIAVDDIGDLASDSDELVCEMARSRATGAHDIGEKSI